LGCPHPGYTLTFLALSRPESRCRSRQTLSCSAPGCTVSAPTHPVLTAPGAGSGHCQASARAEEKHPHHGGQEDKVTAELTRPSLESWGGKGPSPPGSPGSLLAPGELGLGQAEPWGTGRSRGSRDGESCSFGTGSAPAGLKQGQKPLCHPPGQPLHQPASNLQTCSQSLRLKSC